jgi:indole-3-acetate monooxygenase
MPTSIEKQASTITPIPTPDPVAAARGLAQLVNDHREALSKGPDLPSALADGLIQAGLTQLWLPHVFGGQETAPLDFIRTIEALARLDGAVAWCAMISSSASRFAGLVAEEPMRELLASATMNAFSGSAQPGGTITRDGDGWRISGSWRLASFSRHSTLSGVVCVEQENGAPRMDARGGKVVRAALLPSSKVRVVDNWNSGGLRSTGSHDITCNGVRVPDEYTTTMDMPQRQPGPLYNLPMSSAGTIALVGVPLGIAAASIDALIALSETKVPQFSVAPLREQEHVQLEVAWAKTRLLAARAFVFETVSDLWDSVSSGQPASVEQQTLLRMACWNAGEAGKEVVSRMYSAAGSNALREEATFAAQLRDINAACLHVGFSRRLMVPSGRLFLGLEPGPPML